MPCQFYLYSRHREYIRRARPSTRLAKKRPSAKECQTSRIYAIGPECDNYVQFLTRSTANYTQLTAYVAASSREVRIFEMDYVTPGSKRVTVSQVTSNFRVGISGRYRWR